MKLLFENWRKFLESRRPPTRELWVPKDEIFNVSVSRLLPTEEIFHDNNPPREDLGREPIISEIAIREKIKLFKNSEAPAVYVVNKLPKDSCYSYRFPDGRQLAVSILLSLFISLSTVTIGLKLLKDLGFQKFVLI